MYNLVWWGEKLDGKVVLFVGFEIFFKKLLKKLYVTMSWSVVLLQLESVLMSVAHVTTEGYVNVHGLCCNLNPCWCSWAMLLLESYWDERPSLPLEVIVMSSYMHCWKPGLGLRSCCSWSQCWCLWPIWPPKAMQISMVYAAAWDHADVYGPGFLWGPCLGLWSYCSGGGGEGGEGCIHSLCCCQKLCGIPGSMFLLTIKQQRNLLWH